MKAWAIHFFVPGEGICINRGVVVYAKTGTDAILAMRSEMAAGSAKRHLPKSDIISADRASLADETFENWAEPQKDEIAEEIVDAGVQSTRVVYTKDAYALMPVVFKRRGQNVKVWRLDAKDSR